MNVIVKALFMTGKHKMTINEMQREAEIYINNQLNTMKQYGSAPKLTKEQKNKLILHAMRVIGYKGRKLPND